MNYKDRWRLLRAALEMMQEGAKLRRPNAEYLQALRDVRRELNRIGKLRSQGAK